MIALVIDGLFSALEHGLTLIGKYQKIGLQSGELTAAQNAAYEERKRNFFNSPAMQTDADRAAGRAPKG